MRFSFQIETMLMVIGLACGTAQAQTTWYVDDDNCPGPGKGTMTDPFCSIQTGINTAVNGDTVLVSPGTYHELINFLGKAITLRSSDGADVTTIDGAGLSDSVVKCISGEGLDTILDGFTITRSSIGSIGSGMQNDNSSPTVRNCTFLKNTAASGGGGMKNLNGSSPTVRNCTFSENTAGPGGNGGGMFNRNGSSPSVIDCTFSGNTAWDGGGIMSDIDSSPTVINCMFSGNVAHYGFNPFGGGMYNSNNTVATITNCTFSGNTAGLSGGGIVNLVNSRSEVTNCVLWGNSDGGGIDESAQIHNDGTSESQVNYSCVQGTWSGNGANNIDTNPMFVDHDGADNVLGTDDDDLRLLLGSPAIDAGNNASVSELEDIDGNQRIVNCIVDMGAYEHPAPCTAPDPDSDDDGICDACDNCPGLSNPAQTDCQPNGIGDVCDINDGTSQDCDHNGVPDECEGLCVCDFTCATATSVRSIVAIRC